MEAKNVYVLCMFLYICMYVFVSVLLVSYFQSVYSEAQLYTVRHTQWLGKKITKHSIFGGSGLCCYSETYENNATGQR